MTNLKSLLLCTLLVGSHAMAATDRAALESELMQLLDPHGGRTAFRMPYPWQYSQIPQDANNRITHAKVRLGQFLYHETGVGTAGNNPERSETFGCASCHHVQAGFKAGIPQGIGEGGSGFGKRGETRRLAAGMNGNAAEGAANHPDIQPVTSPTTLNVAYQDSTDR